MRPADCLRSAPRQRTLTAALLFLAFAGATACGSDDPADPGPGPDPVDISGSYTLQSVSKFPGAFQELPATISGGLLGGTYEFTGGSLTLAANGTYTLTSDITFSDAAGDTVVSVNDAGTFTESGGDLSLVSTTGPSQDRSGSVLEGDIFVDVRESANIFEHQFEKQ